MTISTYLSIITLSVHGLNASIKRHRMADWTKTKTLQYAAYKSHFSAKDTHRLKVREWKKIFHANGNDKSVGVAILISDKIDFKTKAITKDRGII